MTRLERMRATMPDDLSAEDVSFLIYCAHRLIELSAVGYSRSLTASLARELAEQTVKVLQAEVSEAS